MSKQRSCRLCGQPAEFRLGELTCLSCGHVVRVHKAQPLAADAPLRQAPASLDDSLVRSPSADAAPQLNRLLGGRAMLPKVDYGSGLPSATEMGTFLSCFFIGQVLMQLVVSVVFGTGLNLIGSLFGSAIFTMVLAYVLSQQIFCLKNAVLLCAVLLALMSLWVVWISISNQQWLSLLFAVYNLGISGWLASILSRQSSME